MKYIGATDAFIRLPFVIEGLVIGIIGSAIGFILITGLYRFAVHKYLTDLDNMIQFLDPSFIAGEIMILYFIIGVVVGALGSAISIRKYLRV